MAMKRPVRPMRPAPKAAPRVAPKTPVRAMPQDAPKSLINSTRVADQNKINSRARGRLLRTEGIVANNSYSPGRKPSYSSDSKMTNREITKDAATFAKASGSIKDQQKNAAQYFSNKKIDQAEARLQALSKKLKK
jgi:hypothetical protein